MTQYLGDFPYGATVYIPFASYSSAGASVTLTGLAVTDIEIYKNGSVTQRASDAGYVLLDTDGIDFDAVTGIHGFSIDTSNNTTAGFWGPGNDYFVVVASVTIDSQTVNFIYSFSIENRAASGLLQRTTIATLASQTSFTLTAGSADNDAYNGCMIIVYDQATPVQKAVGVINDYTGSTKTVTLQTDPAVFTMATGDYVVIIGDRALKSTVDNRPLDVSTGGEGGLDWANIGSPTTAQNLSGTNIDVDQIVASVSGAVGSVTGAVGSIAAGGIANASFAADAITAAKLHADVTTELQSGLATAAALDTVDNLLDTEIAAIISTLGTPAGASISADIAAIEAQTDDIGAAGAGLTAVPWNAAWDAEVQSEVDDALVAQNLDHLVKIAVDTNFATTVHLDSVVGQLADNGTVATFDRTTDSLEALQAEHDTTQSALNTVDDFLDTEVAAIKAVTDAIGATGTGLSAIPWNAAWDAEVQSEATDALNAYDPPTNAEMEARTLAAASYATAAALDTVDNLIDTEVAAIKAVTDLLPNGGALTNLDAAISTRASQTSVNTVDDFLDTEIADIQARLPAALTAGGNIKADGLAINGSTAAAAQLAKSAATIVSGAAIAGTLSTTQMTTNLTEATDDHYNGRIIIWTSGVLIDQATDIIDYTGATKLLTYTAVTEAPTAADTFIVV